MIHALMQTRSPAQGRVQGFVKGGVVGELAFFPWQAKQNNNSNKKKAKKAIKQTNKMNKKQQQQQQRKIFRYFRVLLRRYIFF